MQAGGVQVTTEEISESPSVASLRAELGKHATVDPVECRMRGYSVPEHMVTHSGRVRFQFKGLGPEQPSAAARLIAAMRGGR